MDPQQTSQHAPYLPPVAMLGGTPTNSVDTPITAVFLALFIGSAVGHMSVFQVNRRRSHKFIISALIFGFSMARIATCVMRIVWANYQENASIAIAANIFVTAGVLLLFIVNLIFSQRMVRAAHPNVGWHGLFSYAFVAMYVMIIFILAMVITVTVQSYYTLNANTRRIDRDIQLFAGTFFAVMSFLPIPLVIGTLVVPHQSSLEKFGSGSWRTKVFLVLTSTVLLCLGASFRIGVNFQDPRPKTNPAWYHSRACFYLFNLGVEIIVAYLYLVMRADQRFHVPDGSKGAGDYSRGNGRIGSLARRLSQLSHGHGHGHAETQNDHELGHELERERQEEQKSEQEQVQEKEDVQERVQEQEQEQEQEHETEPEPENEHKHTPHKHEQGLELDGGKSGKAMDFNNNSKPVNVRDLHMDIELIDKYKRESIHRFELVEIV